MAERERNPLGFVRKHPDTKSTRWQAVVKYPDPETAGKWKQRSKTFARKSDAQRWVDSTIVEHRMSSQYRPPSHEQLGAFLERWLDETVAGNLRESTTDRYRLAARHIMRHLGSMPLSRIQSADVQNLQSRLLKDGLAASTVKLVHVVLHRACEDAVTQGLLVVNPVTRVKAPMVKRKELTIPTIETAQTLLKAARHHRLYALWVLMASTGLRRGEVVALKWSDVDWSAQVLRVQRTVSRYGAKRRLEPPKTRSGMRTVALSPYLMAVLKEHRDQQNLDRLAAGLKWQENDWIFTTRNGTWLSPHHLYQYFKALVRRAGVSSEIRLHDLRHAMATHWLAQGIPVKVVSERLGHANISITLEIYAHLLPNMQAGAAKQMDDIYFHTPLK